MHRYIDVVQIWRFVLPVPPGFLPKWPRIAYDVGTLHDSATFAWITRPREWVLRPTNPLSLHFTGGPFVFKARRDCVISNFRITDSVGTELYRLVSTKSLRLMAGDVYALKTVVLCMEYEVSGENLLKVVNL